MTTFIAEDYPILEPGSYPATFERTEESEEPGQYGYWIDWYFTAVTADGPAEVMGRSSLPDRWTRSTKAREWYEAIAGQELAKGEPADTMRLKGTPVTLTLDIVKTKKGDERNRIVSIRRRAAAPAVTSAPEPDPDYQAWLAEQAAKKAAIDAANAEEPPLPEAPADLDDESEAA